MPLFLHMLLDVVATATFSKNSNATSLPEVIINNVTNDEVENADVQYDTYPAVPAPNAMPIASLMAASATLAGANQACAQPACVTHFVVGVFQVLFPAADHPSSGFHHL